MLKSILKGMVIGVANIIPGVSGGTMMVSMGIYDKLIHAITHLFSEFKKSFKFVLPILIGMAAGIVILSFLIEYLFDVYPVQTNLFFIGLIVGGLPAIYSKVKSQPVKPTYILAFLAFFVVVVGFAAVGEVDSAAGAFTISFINCIKLFLVGVIAAATMVIPGVSGSMVLMLLGYYNLIISNINDFVSSLVSFNISGIINGILILVPFGIGVIVGIFAIAKLIEIIFNKFPYYAYWAIIGLIAASPFAIVLMNDFSGINVVSVITGVVALFAGCVVAYKLGE